MLNVLFEICSLTDDLAWNIELHGVRYLVVYIDRLFFTYLGLVGKWRR